jgi:hypothetical protein
MRYKIYRAYVVYIFTYVAERELASEEMQNTCADTIAKYVYGYDWSRANSNLKSPKLNKIKHQIKAKATLSTTSTCFKRPADRNQRWFPSSEEHCTSGLSELHK